MRKLMTALLSIAAIGAAAQPALADDPAATRQVTQYSWGDWARCNTPFKAGVDRQYGAWGAYIDGCTTTRIYCPKTTCTISNQSTIDVERRVGHQVTMNARTRIYAANGALRTYEDMSCVGTDYCMASKPRLYMGLGESVTVQCNGVRQIGLNRATDSCNALLYYTR